MTVDAIQTPRQRARAQAMLDIKRIAREQLASEGSSALSLRGIARELGIVSSAVYRYVPSRDELLTMLIEDAYNSLGEVAEAADGACARPDLRGRWRAIGHAVRTWAVEQPYEYALIYGSPVPGYTAPVDRTGDPGSRVSLLLLAILVESERVDPPGDGSPEVEVPPLLGTDFEALRQALGLRISDDRLARGFLAWSSLFGLISFELFGQFKNAVEHLDAYFDHQLDRLALLIGLPE
jgi:AcrR family transcriptional regulator